MTYRSTINGQSGAPYIDEALTKNGPLINVAPVPPEVIGMYEARLPALVLDIWDNYGVGDLGKGRLRLCIPRSLQQVVNLLFEGDPYLGGDTYALAYGAFGDLILWNTRYQMVYVNMQLSSVEVPALISPNLRGPDDEVVLAGLLQGHPEMGDAFDENGDEMFKPAQEKYGPLPPLSIYGMFPPVPYDEAFSVANHRITEAEDWLAIKISESTFSLDDPMARRFGIRNIGPLPEGQPLIPAGEL